MGRPLSLSDRDRPHAAPLPDADHIEANKVRGCASQVWLTTQVSPNGADGPVLTFVGDSDAHIVRGLIAVPLALYSGEPARKISTPMPSRCSKTSASRIT